MPDVFSVGLGGGTKVEIVDDAAIVGPESVGHRLTQEALVFGGSVLTTTGEESNLLQLRHSNDHTDLS